MYTCVTSLLLMTLTVQAYFISPSNLNCTFRSPIQGDPESECTFPFVVNDKTYIECVNPAQYTPKDYFQLGGLNTGSWCSENPTYNDESSAEWMLWSFCDCVEVSSDPEFPTSSPTVPSRSPSASNISTPSNSETHAPSTFAPFNTLSPASNSPSISPSNSNTNSPVLSKSPSSSTNAPTNSKPPSISQSTSSPTLLNTNPTSAPSSISNTNAPSSISNSTGSPSSISNTTDSPSSFSNTNAPSSISNTNAPSSISNSTGSPSSISDTTDSPSSISNTNAPSSISNTNAPSSISNSTGSPSSISNTTDSPSSISTTDAPSSISNTNAPSSISNSTGSPSNISNTDAPSSISNTNAPSSISDTTDSPSSISNTDAPSSISNTNPPSSISNSTGSPSSISNTNAPSSISYSTVSPSMPTGDTPTVFVTPSPTLVLSDPFLNTTVVYVSSSGLLMNPWGIILISVSSILFIVSSCICLYFNKRSSSATLDNYRSVVPRKPILQKQNYFPPTKSTSHVLLEETIELLESNWRPIHLVCLKTGALLCYSNVVRSKQGHNMYLGELWSYAPGSIQSIHYSRGKRYSFTITTAWGTKTEFCARSSTSLKAWTTILQKFQSVESDAWTRISTV